MIGVLCLLAPRLSVGLALRTSRNASQPLEVIALF